MKNSKIFYLLITLLVVSCNTAEDVEVIYDNEIIEQEESSTEQSTQVVEEKETEVLVTTETLELDRNIETTQILYSQHLMEIVLILDNQLLICSIIGIKNLQSISHIT